MINEICSELNELSRYDALSPSPVSSILSLLLLLELSFVLNFYYCSHLKLSVLVLIQLLIRLLLNLLTLVGYL